MGRGTTYIIVATIEYDEYHGIKEMLDAHSVLSIIKPHEEDEHGQPVGTLVDLYVSNESKALTLLSGNVVEHKEEPLQTVKVTGHIVKLVPFLNKPLPVYFIYLLLTAAILAACVFVALHQKRSVF